LYRGAKSRAKKAQNGSSVRSKMANPFASPMQREAL
jgi:hypothetical protein